MRQTVSEPGKNNDDVILSSGAAGARDLTAACGATDVQTNFYGSLIFRFDRLEPDDRFTFAPSELGPFYKTPTAYAVGCILSPLRG